MKPNLPHEEFIQSLIKKINKHIYIYIYLFIIICLYKLIDFFNIFKSDEILFCICVILVCLVLLKDIIYKCFEIACKTIIAIEKEKTERERIAKESNNKNIVDQEGVKIYKFNQK